MSRILKWAGRIGPIELVASLGLLGVLMSLVTIALVLDGDGPKALRVGLAFARRRR